jgi:outer membrane lipoprotein-sorting protein
MDYTFSNERLNPPLDAKLFQFQPPAGAQVVDLDNP